MNWIGVLAWGSAGFVLALIFFIMQRWTVFHIEPHKVKQGKWLVIAGAFFRWMIFSILIFLALQVSLASVLTVFFTFLIARMILLISFSQVISAKPGKTS